MTPKERRDAQIELRDMAYELERQTKDETRDKWSRRLRRATFLRAVAAELDRVPEEQ